LQYLESRRLLLTTGADDDDEDEDEDDDGDGGDGDDGVDDDDDDDDDGDGDGDWCLDGVPAAPWLWWLMLLAADDDDGDAFTAMAIRIRARTAALILRPALQECEMMIAWAMEVQLRAEEET
jgi:hypothetical protein